jgi:hypothetical protein
LGVRRLFFVVEHLFHGQESDGLVVAMPFLVMRFAEPLDFQRLIVIGMVHL